MPLWAVGRAGNVDIFFVRTWFSRAQAFAVTLKKKRPCASMIRH